MPINWFTTSMMAFASLCFSLKVLVTAIITGNCESTISAHYLNSRGLTLCVWDGSYTEALSIQTMGGFFTCLIQFKLSELATDVDITLGLDWLSYLQEHFSNLGVVIFPSNAVCCSSYAYEIEPHLLVHV